MTTDVRPVYPSNEMALRTLASIAFAAAAIAIAPAALADDPDPGALTVRSVGFDILVTSAGAGTLLVTELNKADIAAPACKWCSVNPFDKAVRNALVSKNPDAADTASNVLAYGIPGAGLIATALLDGLHAGSASQGLTDTLLIAEPMAVAMALDQHVKFVVGRQRPYAAFNNSRVHLDKSNPDANLSFFSGHTTLSFSAAAATGTVLWMRGYRWAPWVWVGGGVFSTTVGMLRIAADRHYATDVLTGMVVGAASGFLIPYLAHRPRSWATTHALQFTGAPAPGGGTVGLGGLW